MLEWDYAAEYDYVDVLFIFMFSILYCAHLYADCDIAIQPPLPRKKENSQVCDKVINRVWVSEVPFK